MNTYEQKQEARRQRLEAAAEKAAIESATRLNAAHAVADRIPLGQPILVGHHSEGRHRRDAKRIDSNMRKGVEAHKRAEELARKAESVGSAGISSDDPDAIQKLKAELARLGRGNTVKYRRIKARIAELEAAATSEPRTPIEGEGWRVVEDRDINRVCIVFDGKPGEEIRTQLKRAGFRWSPTRGVWMRMLNEQGWYAAKRVMGVV